MSERKFSVKREEILNLLQGTSTHPGARWVFDQLKLKIPDLSLATVYRNLNIFCEEEKALSLGVINGEERFDGISESHPHMVCSSCGSVIDLPSAKVDTLIQDCKKLSMETSFNIDFRKTVFYGLCKDCQGNLDNHKNHGGDDDGAPDAA